MSPEAKINRMESLRAARRIANAQRQAERRHRARAAGVCICCFRAPAKAEQTKCERCAAWRQGKPVAPMPGRPSQDAIHARQGAMFCLECIASGGYHRVGCAVGEMRRAA